MVFLPLLPAVAAGRLEVDRVAWSVEGLAGRARFTLVRGRVEAVGDGWLSLDTGERLEFDYAIVALGARPNFYSVEGAAEHSVTLYTLEDAVRIRNALEEGAGFIVVGAGPVGVEVAGELAARGAEVYLVEMLEEPLAMLGNRRASRLARRLLERLGVRLAMGRRVVRVGDGFVEVEGSGRIGCSGCLVVWTAGIRGPGVRVECPDAMARWGFIAVGSNLMVRGAVGY
jgi:NADH dehydrogenase